METSIQKRGLLVIEGLCILVVLVLCGFWYQTGGDRFEPVIVIVGLVSIAVDLWRRYQTRALSQRFASSEERIKHRERLRKEFEAEILKCRVESLNMDAIIRHVDRVDNYPDAANDDQGISPWFRVGLMDTYDKGIVVGLSIGGLVETDNGYRFRDWVNGEESDLKVWLLGDIPYDSIVAVNTDGDLFYWHPQIFCHFDYNGEPYERLRFCERIDQRHGHPYFRHIADFSEVEENSSSLENLSFG